MSKKNDPILWHYTNYEGLLGIIQSGKINPSTDTKSDALLGPGVYLTRRNPSLSNEALYYNNYGSNSMDRADKLDYAIGFRAKDIPKKYLDNVIMGGDWDRNIICLNTEKPLKFDIDKAIIYDRNNDSEWD